MIRKIFGLLFCIALLAVTGISAQTVVNIEKPGGLKKALGKDITSIISLKVTGIINEKDYAVLMSMPNLHTLNLSEAEIRSTKNAKWKYNGVTYYAPAGNHINIDTPIKNLFPPKNIGYIRNAVEGDNIIPSFDNLYVSNNINFGLARYVNVKNLHIAPAVISLDRASKLESRKKNNESGLDKVLVSQTLTYSTEDNEGGRIKVDTLFLPHKDGWYSEVLYHVHPKYVFFEDDKSIALNYYDGTERVLDLTKYSRLCDFALAGCSSIEKVILGDNIKVIPEGCFYGCSNLKDINLDNVESIENLAFGGTSLDNIKLGKNVKRIGGCSFFKSTIKTIELESKYAPEILGLKEIEDGWSIRRYKTPKGSVIKMAKDDRWYDALKEISFIIPQGSGERYDIGDWKELNVQEKGTKTDYEFVLDEPSSLKNFINNTNAKKIVTLTLKGIMDDREFAILRQCKNLKYLDLTYLFAKKSAQTQEQEKEDREFLLALIGASAELAEAKEKEDMNNGIGDAGRMLQASFGKAYIDQVFEQEKNKKVVADPNCYIPKDAFEGLNALEEIHFPLQLKTLKTHLPNSIKNVVLPDGIEYIGRGVFAGTKISEFIAPKALKKIGAYAFSNCKELKIIDLKFSSVVDIGEYGFKGCKELQEFHGSKCLKTMGPYTFNEVPLNSCVGYLYTKEEPVGDLWSCLRKLHIPTGCKAGYRHDDTDTVDDIEW